jgi:hypothetical protein
MKKTCCLELTGAENCSIGLIGKHETMPIQKRSEKVNGNNKTSAVMVNGRNNLKHKIKTLILILYLCEM